MVPSNTEADAEGFFSEFDSDYRVDYYWASPAYFMDSRRPNGYPSESVL